MVGRQLLTGAGIHDFRHFPPKKRTYNKKEQCENHAFLMER